MIKPLSLLNQRINSNVMVELKGGRGYRGILEGFDPHMNLVLRAAEETQDSQSQRKMDLAIVRGTTSFTSPHDVGGRRDQGDRVARQNGKEKRPHPVPTLWPASVQQTESVLRLLRIREDQEASKFLLGEEALTMARDQGTSEFSDLRPKEKCGIIGCAGTTPITSDLYYGLRILQHRGQESAGL